jgi:hypothetical protein
MSLPPPSARTCTVVLNPPRLRPRASTSGSLFLPPPHAEAPGPWCHQRNAPPSRSCHQHRPGFARSQRCAPKFRPCATGRSGWPPWTRGHSARVNPARERRCAKSTRCHSQCADGREQDVQYAVFVGGAAVAAAPIEHWSSLRGSCATV